MTHRTIPLIRLRGVRIALSVPLWLRPDRMAELTSATIPPADPGPPPAQLGPCLGSALLTLRFLARLPGRRWRNTCLYRSLLATRCIRQLGGHAVLRIGVRPASHRDDALSGPIAPVEAHAWVQSPWLDEDASEAPASPAARFVILGRAAGAPT